MLSVKDVLLVGVWDCGGQVGWVNLLHAGTFWAEVGLLVMWRWMVSVLKTRCCWYLQDGSFYQM